MPDVTPAAPPAVAPTPTRESVQGDIDSLVTTMSGATYDNTMPAHQEHVKQLAQLYEQRESFDRPTTTPAPTTETPLPLPDLPAGLAWAPHEAAGVQEFATVAPHLGIAPEETHELLRYAVANLTTDPPDPAVTLADLKREWGKDFDKNMAVAQHNYSLLPATTRALMEQNDFDNDPKIIRRLAQAGGERFGAEIERERIMRDPRHPMHKAYWGAMDERHAEAVAHVKTLLLKAREIAP